MVQVLGPSHSSRIVNESPRQFFLQAEDGKRDGHVTGVQTCALPISSCGTAPPAARVGTKERPAPRRPCPRPARAARSEERRVGKECRSRLEPSPCKEHSYDDQAHVIQDILRCDRSYGHAG